MRSYLFPFLAAVILAMRLTAQQVSGPWLVVAVGEPPLPKLKVVESDGFIGYEAGEMTPESIFPTAWLAMRGEAGDSFELKLSPEGVILPASSQPLTRVIPANGGSAAPGATRNFASKSIAGPAVVLVYKSKPNGSWNDDYDSLVVPCSLYDSRQPTATVVNLCAVPIEYVDADKSPATLAPGATAAAMVLLHPKSGVSKLPLYAKSGDTRMDMSLVPVVQKGRYAPLVVVHPVGQAQSGLRPLRTAVFQISEFPVRKEIP